MKAKYRIFNLILILIVISCTDKKKDVTLNPTESICFTNNPLEDLPWLKEIKTFIELNENAAGGEIIAYKYNGEDVFLVDDCYNCADKMVLIYDCSGQIICKFGGIAGINTCPDFFETATDSTMLYNNIQN